MSARQAAQIVLAQFRRLRRSAERQSTRKVLEQLEHFENRVYYQMLPADECTYHVSKDWTAKGLGMALVSDQLIDRLAQKAGEDLVLAGNDLDQPCAGFAEHGEMA